MATEKSVISEIAERADAFDKDSATFLSEIGQWADLYKCKPGARQDRTFSNPRQTEFHRAANTVGTMAFRMMTAADPSFSAMPVDLNADYDSLDTIVNVLKTQQRYARYRPNLFRACLFAPVFGTVICQEDYRVIGVSAFGRRIPVTVLIPRVLDQVMYDRSTIDIHSADWLATADVTSAAEMMRLASEAKDIGTPWNKKALEAAAKSEEQANTISHYVKERIRRSGFSEDDALKSRKELLMFYGKLDCMNDGLEYVAAVINRRFLVRFHANNFQHGRRPFRVAKWHDFDHALGYGMGHILANQHKSMDANRQKAQDLMSFAAYNMWKRRKNTVEDEQLIIRPLQVVDVDNHDDLTPLAPNLMGADGILRLDDILKAEFRAASGASDTLQAIASDAVTATASSLAQNEAMRFLSVKSEMLSEPLGREHLENSHWNNVQNIDQPFNINKAGIVKTVYPKDLRYDVEFEWKVTTDKDFTPQRLDKLIQTLQILTSTKSSHPDLNSIDIRPLVKQIAYSLDVKPSDIMPNNPAMAPGMGAMMGAGDMAGLAQMTAPGAPAGGMGMVGTPVGATLT